jgi:peptidoglycan L-alanyl-D-glutamate endopeptidase CwlK
MDAASEVKLALVCPKLATLIRALAGMVTDEPIRVTQGLRTWAEQEAIYQQGRTTPGEIVTNARPGYSWHQFGLAVDVAPFDSEGNPDWNETHPVWKQLITFGESLGMYSGDEFTHHDDPHFQLTGIFPVTPNDDARQILQTQGLQAVWDTAGLTAA